MPGTPQTGTTAIESGAEVAAGPLAPELTTEELSGSRFIRRLPAATMDAILQTTLDPETYQRVAEQARELVDAIEEDGRRAREVETRTLAETLRDAFAAYGAAGKSCDNLAQQVLTDAEGSAKRASLLDVFEEVPTEHIPEAAETVHGARTTARLTLEGDDAILDAVLRIKGNSHGRFLEVDDTEKSRLNLLHQAHERALPVHRLANAIGQELSRRAQDGLGITGDVTRLSIEERIEAARAKVEAARQAKDKDAEAGAMQAFCESTDELRRLALGQVGQSVANAELATPKDEPVNEVITRAQQILQKRPGDPKAIKQATDVLQSVTAGAIATHFSEGMLGEVWTGYLRKQKEEWRQINAMLDSVANLSRPDLRSYLWERASASGGLRAEYIRWQDLFAAKENTSLLDTRIHNLSEAFMALLGGPTAYRPNGDPEKNSAVHGLRQTLRAVSGHFFVSPSTT